MVEELSRHGDLARVDASLAGTLGRILVTFFDVRSAQQALIGYPGRAEPFAPMAHDCRVVSITQAAFVEKVCSGGNLRNFGEVANVSIFLGHLTIEFYDLRAAQKLLVASHGSAVPVPMEMLREMFPPKPSHQPQEAPQEFCQATLGTPQQMLQQLLQQALVSQEQQRPRTVQPYAAAAAEEAAAPMSLGPLASLGLMAPGLLPDPTAALVADPVAALLADPVLATMAPALLPAPTVLPITDPAILAAGTPKAGAGPSMAPIAADPAGGRNRNNRQRASGAVHTKVAVWDFAKFDIDPDKIRRGQDARTTVMVRNLSAVGSRKTFLAFLDRIGLGDRFTFIHMPCKEHRRVLAGFAFINLCAPDDVHKLFVSLKKGALNEFLGDNSAKMPSVSYARFQGQDELVKLFSTTAVLHEQDPERRPLFRKGSGPSGPKTTPAAAGGSSNAGGAAATARKVEPSSSAYPGCKMNLALGA